MILRLATAQQKAGPFMGPGFDVFMMLSMTL